MADIIHAAGALIVDTAGKALFLKRGPGGDAPGMWCIPGGHLESDETAQEGAVREVEEESGFRLDPDRMQLLARTRSYTEIAGAAVDFTTFIVTGIEPFTPELGPVEAPEHVAFAWTPPGEPPEPLHPGCRIALARLTMDELGVAKAIAAGELTSPQRYGKVWLFDIRITGTGASYRPSLKEVVWRDSSLYLTEDFLQRCAGLPVVWVHPETKTMIDGEEFADRAIGTVFFPHIVNDEVWGVARIYDAAAAEMMTNDGLSTSPGVVFTAASGNQELKLKDGSTLLIEGKPALLDHIAIVSAGVWDKGGAPSGVSSTEVAMPEKEEERTEERIDTAAVMDALTKIGAKLDSAHSRLDAMESARKDAETEKERKEREERQDAARLDAARKDKFSHRKDQESEEEYKARHDADEEAMLDELEKGGVEKEKAREDARRARKDAESGEERERAAKEGRREDSRRNDARRARKDEESEEERERAAARHDALAAENATLKTRLGTLEGRLDEMTRETPPQERDALAAAQARADSVCAMFAERASAPVPGETSLAYRKRLLGRFLKYSERFKEARLDSTDSVILGAIEDQVYAEAATAARRIDSASPGILIPIIERDSAGRQITRFNGDNLAWMAPFMTGGQIGRINRNPKASA